ncbi:MAG TPA: AAA family ATPase, partial [Euzebyales bacterium]|nr:AAA family ATPase [Euzebyales bacterium]
MDAGLLSIVLDRLEGARRDGGDVDAQVETQVLAACEDRLDAVLAGADYTRPAAQDVRVNAPPGAYLGDITVEGFRGIGERGTLPLSPGPGLTLVVGRNGSGKSSFAEAAEMLFTGSNLRWATRPSIWQDGWRNLHHRQVCAISAQLAIDGEAGPVELRRRWDDGADLDAAATVTRAPDGTTRPIAELGWEQALVAFRPFLSYNELGSMLEGKPSELHDAMSSILGLDDLERATRALGEARRVRARYFKDAKAALAPLLADLAAADDERAARCHEALRGRTWDLDAVDEVLVSDDPDGEAGGVLATLRGLASLDCPSQEQVEKVTRELREAQAQVDAVAGTDAGRADALVRVLVAALAAHDDHGDQDCPVC